MHRRTAAHRHLRPAGVTSWGRRCHQPPGNGHRPRDPIRPDLAHRPMRASDTMRIPHRTRPFLLDHPQVVAGPPDERPEETISGPGRPRFRRVSSPVAIRLQSCPALRDDASRMIDGEDKPCRRQTTAVGSALERGPSAADGPYEGIRRPRTNTAMTSTAPAAGRPPRGSECPAATYTHA
jgi:hypothetical protein